MTVNVDGRAVGTFEVRNAEPRSFNFPIRSLAASSKLGIIFSNDAVIEGEDRNLIVHSVNVEGRRLELTSGVFDVGTGDAAFDSIDLRTFSASQNMRYVDGAPLFVLRSGLAPHQVALIINENDPLSVALGEYDQLKNKLPIQNIVRVSLPLVPVISRSEFATLQQTIAAVLPAYTQSIAIAWTYPHSVECNSITSSVTLGFDGAPCADTCTAGQVNPLYGSPTKVPFAELGIRTSMLLTGRSLS